MSQHHNRDGLFADLDYDIGDTVAVQPDVQGGHRQGGDENLVGRVTNRRKDNCVFQYLVDLFDGGRRWYDADCVVDAEQTTPIYGHRAGDGIAFVSFGVDYPVVEYLNGKSPTERVEAAWFGAWDDETEEYIDEALIAEPDRKADPPRVGTLEFNLTTGEYEAEILDPEEVLG